MAQGSVSATDKAVVEKALTEAKQYLKEVSPTLHQSYRHTIILTTLTTIITLTTSITLTDSISKRLVQPVNNHTTTTH